MPALCRSLILILALLPQAPSLPLGTRIEARLESAIRTSSSAVGEDVFAVLTKPIRLESRTIVPEGTRLDGRIETIVAANRSTQGRVRLVFREMEFQDGLRVSTWITESYSAALPKPGRRYLLWMGFGAAAGGLVGGTTARVSGILGGSLIGFVIANNSSDSTQPDLTMRPGTILHLQVGEDTLITPGHW